jgi:hypothetical protein
MKMEQTECSETLACKIQMPGDYPEENIQHLSVLLRAILKLCVFNTELDKCPASEEMKADNISRI